MEKKTYGIGYDFCAFLNYDFSNDFSLYEIGNYQCPPLYSYGPVIRAKAILHYVTGGEGRLVINNREFKIKEKQAFLIPAGVKAFYEADSQNPWNYIWLHLGGPMFSDIMEKAGLNEDSPVFISTDNKNPLDALFEEILLHHEQEYYCMGKLYELADYLVRYSANKQEEQINLQMNYVRKIIKFIQFKYSEPIQVADIASVLGLNRSYLTRLFKEATGSSIQNYLFSYRMKMAIKLLENPEHSVQYVAFAVGYNDSFTFSKAFKRYTGKAPKDYYLDST